MHIEIITTPNEALKESGFSALNAYNSVLGSIQTTGSSVCKTKLCLENVVKRKPDLIVLAVKYIPIIFETSGCYK